MATPPSANQGIRMPDTAEKLKDVPAFVTAMGLDLEEHIVMWFASVSERNTKVPTPEEGMVAWMKDSNTLVVYDGSGWVTVYPAQPQVTSGTDEPSGTPPTGSIYIRY